MRFLFLLSSFGDTVNVIIKDKRKLVALIVGIIGVLLILLSATGENRNTKTKEETYTLDQYKAALEEELEELCESIDGVGKCSVTVTFSEGERLEYKGSNLISSEPPRVLGITVVCEGADSVNVKRDISECMKALFEIGSNRVSVLKMK